MPFHTDRQRKAVMAKLNRGNPNSDVQPTIVGKIKVLAQRFRETREARIEATTKQETQKLKTLEMQLSKRLKIEEKRQKGLEVLREKTEKLEAIKVQEAKTRQALESFTVRGKIKSRLKSGVKLIQEDIAKRRAFLKTPEGQRQVKAARERRQKFFKKLGKIKLV